MAEHKQYPDSYPAEASSPPSEAAPCAPAAPVEESVATILKETREQYGRGLRDVAGTLNIRFVYLEAIEAGEFDKLPGTAYAIGFIRSYADYLGLDSKDMVRQFKAEVAGFDGQTQLVFPTPVPESKVPGGALILVSIVCFSLAYGAWSFFSSRESQVADLVPAVPERLQPLIDEVATSVPGPGDSATGEAVAAPESQLGLAVPADAAPIESPPLETQVPSVAADSSAPAAAVEEPPAPAAVTAEATTVEPAEAAPAAAETQVSTATPEPVETPSTAIPAAPATVPATPSEGTDESALAAQVPQVYGRENTDSRIILRAIQDSWVQIRNSQDDLLLTRVLRAGDSYRVPDQPGLTLLTGNAGGLEIEVDGSLLGPVGPVGSVRRNVALDPARLASGSTIGQ